MLAKTNQALGTLDTYRQRLEQALLRLTALEFQNAVMLDDVLVVLQRAAMTSRMAERIERDCVELGSEGRLIRMQLEELVATCRRIASGRPRLPRGRRRRGGDAGARGPPGHALPRPAGVRAAGRAARLPEGVNPLDRSVAPRGFRVLSHIPRLPDAVIRRVVGDLGSLDTVIRASQRDLEAVEGVGAVRAREIREGLRRLQEHNLVDRYLQL